MGYFSNGSEGHDYEARYCRRCVHGDGDGAGYCAVWLAHLLLNYEACNDRSSPLHLLIPRSGIENEQCRMFIERSR